MDKQIKCFLCAKDNVTYKDEFEKFYKIISCPTCGDIYVSDEMIPSNGNDLCLCKKKTTSEHLTGDELEKAKIALRYYYKDKTIRKIKPEILWDNMGSTPNSWEGIVNSVPYPASLLEKIDKVLEYFKEKTFFLNEHISLNLQCDYPLFFCKNSNEFYQILCYLVERLFIGTKTAIYPDVSEIYLTPEGIKHIEQQRKNIKSNQCFVAMWFNEDETKGSNMEKIYTDYIVPAIEETDFKFEPRKINDVHHINDINDQIIAEIRRSKFMIADLTGCRGGVYFEAGFGFGLGIPVIYTCHKDWLESQKDKDGNLIREGVHFDLNHRNILLWTDNKEDPEYDKYKLEVFKENLTARINAIIV